MSHSKPGALANYLRVLLFALWGIPLAADPPPRVLVER